MLFMLQVTTLIETVFGAATDRVVTSVITAVVAVSIAVSTAVSVAIVR